MLLANQPELAVRNVSLTELVWEFDYFRDLGYPETAIAWMAQPAAQRERLATAEAAVSAAAADTPATPVAFPLRLCLIPTFLRGYSQRHTPC